MVWLALALGRLMLAAGVLLFVAAHWEALSPDQRFVVVVCGATGPRRSSPRC
ncbi:MAG: DUF2157 domain-containing protein [Gemmatimonadales bacterium]|nr:DUF2157 domain-containing protein [Gemmatimonadales bacterium]